MEGEKMDGKKKRHKKKKGNHTKNAEDTALNTDEIAAENQSHDLEFHQNHNGLSIVNEDVQSDEPSAVNADEQNVGDELHRNLNGLHAVNKDVKTDESGAVNTDEPSLGDLKLHQNINGPTAVNADVQSVGVSEAGLEIGRLKAHEAAIAELQEHVKLLESEKSFWIQKVAYLDDRLGGMERANDSRMQQEIPLKEAISVHEEANKALQIQVMALKDSTESLIQENQIMRRSLCEMESKVQTLDTKLSSFEASASNEQKVMAMALKDSSDNLIQENQTMGRSLREIESQMQTFDTKLSSLEASAANEQKVMALKDSLDSLIQENHTIRRSLCEMDSRIQALDSKLFSLEALTGNEHEVMALKDSSGSLIQENHTTRRSLCEMESRIQTLESKLFSLEASAANGQKIQNIQQDDNKAELVSSIGEQNTERAVEINVVESVADDVTPTDETNVATEVTHQMNGVSEPSEIIEESDDDKLLEYQSIIPSSESQENLTVPLDEIRIHEEGPSGAEGERKEEIPLTDAPLIGAPFRFFSFVTKYVTGADLVKGNPSKSALR